MCASDPKNRFLEPVYLNERSVLNCASYLFEGVASTAETTEKSSTSKSGGLKLQIPFLTSFLGTPSIDATADARRETLIRSERQIRVGSVHMQVIDALQTKGMLKVIDPERLTSSPEYSDHFIDTKVLLRPNDYFSLLRTLDIATPLVSKNHMRLRLGQTPEQTLNGFFATESRR